MKDIKIEFTNLNQFIGDINKYCNGVEKGTKDGLKNSGEKVVEEARRRAPVDTGYLRSSIDGNYIDEFEYEVIAEADYAIFVEKGTRYMSPQPFMEVSLDVAEPEFINKIKFVLGGKTIWY